MKSSSRHVTKPRLAIHLARSLALGAVLAVAPTFVAGAAVAVAAPAHQAKVPIAKARAIALARVPGKIVSEELEKEHGRWIYSFEIKPKGETRKIVKEVNVDADTGKIVGHVETERESG